MCSSITYSGDAPRLSLVSFTLAPGGDIGSCGVHLCVWHRAGEATVILPDRQPRRLMWHVQQYSGRLLRAI